MKPIEEKLVQSVVEETSSSMKDPKFATNAIDAWVRTQPNASRYVAAHAKELGGAEHVVTTLFHADLITKCFSRHLGRRVRSLTYAHLDGVARSGQDALQQAQPAVLDYIVANVEMPVMKRLLITIALAIDGLSKA